MAGDRGAHSGAERREGRRVRATPLSEGDARGPRRSRLRPRGDTRLPAPRGGADCHVIAT
eukprot:2435486-Prymnesium_polylepis.1